MILSHARFPVSHPSWYAIKYRRRELNPQNPAFEAGTYAVPSLLHKCLWWESNSQWILVRRGFWARRIYQFCYKGMSTPGGSWTLTESVLSRSPLPLGYGSIYLAGKESNLRCFYCYGSTIRPLRHWRHRPMNAKNAACVEMLQAGGL